MSVWNKILYRFAGRLRAKAIKGPGGEPYLERYMLARFGQHAIFLHRFLASDPDRGLHDHPWSFSASLIVGGGYVEKRLVSKGGQLWMRMRELGAGCFNAIRDDDFHQVVLPPGRFAWTIFYHGPRVKRWGFATSPDCARAVEGPYATVAYEEVNDNRSAEEPWEKSAPKGRELPGRMPEDYCFTKG